MNKEVLGGLAALSIIVAIFIFHGHRRHGVSPTAPVSAVVEKAIPLPGPRPRESEPVSVVKRHKTFETVGTTHVTAEQCARVKAAAAYLSKSQIAAAAKAQGATDEQIRAALVCLAK